MSIDLTVYVEAGKGELFGLEPPSIHALLPPSAPCRADRISLCAHTAGTHTECAAHLTSSSSQVSGDFASVFTSQPAMEPCLVLRVCAVRLQECAGGKETYRNSQPEAEGTEWVVSAGELTKALNRLGGGVGNTLALAPAVMIQVERRHGDDDDWVFFTDQAMTLLVERLRARTLLVNLPSVDRERCGQAMPAHSIFFLSSTRNSDVPPTITESVRTVDAAGLPAGWYTLNLQLSPILGTDAVPSRVLLFPSSSSSSSSSSS